MSSGHAASQHFPDSRFIDSTAEVAAITPHLQPLLAELRDETDPYLLYL